MPTSIYIYIYMEAHVPAAAGSAEGGDGTERWRKEEMARRLLLL